MVSVEVKEIAPCKHQLSIQVDSQEIEEAWEKQLQEISSQAVIPGFRRGKVPRSILEKRFGKELESQVQKDLITEQYEKALKENDFSPLADPAIDQVNFDRKVGLSFSATVEIRPKFELKKYKGISLEKPSAEVEPQEVDDQVENLRRQRAFLEKSDKPAAAGDHLTVSAKFFEGEKEFHSLAHAHVHAGQDHLQDIHIKDLGKKLLKAKLKQEIELDTQLDETFPLPDYQNKSVKLKLTVEEIKVEKLPELDEKFFKSFGAKDVEELKDRLKENIKQVKENEIEEKICEDMLGQIAEPLDIPIPEGVLKRQCMNLIRQTEAFMRVVQAPKEKQEEVLQKEIEEVKSIATTQVRNFFILEEVAKKEKIFVTEKELAQHLSQMALERNQDPEKFIKELRESGGLTEIRLGLKERKTVKWLLSKANVTEVSKDKKEDETQKSISENKKKKTQKKS